MSGGPPADPGQLAWLDAGLSALRATELPERDKLSAIMSLLYYVAGAARLDVELSGAAGLVDFHRYPELLRRLLDADRYPAVAAALEAGAFDASSDDDPLEDFRAGVRRVLDGIAAQAQRDRR